MLKGSCAGFAIVDAGVCFNGVDTDVGVFTSSRLFLPGVGLKPSRFGAGGAGIKLGPKETRLGVCMRWSEACAIGKVGLLVKASISAAWLGCMMGTVCGCGHLSLMLGRGETWAFAPGPGCGVYISPVCLYLDKIRMALLVDELAPDSAHALLFMILGGASLNGFSYEVFNGAIGKTGVTAMIVASMEVAGPVLPLHDLMW